MKGQLQRLGISYAWDREIATCLPDYYRWNQWLFLRMLEKGIAYRRRSSVNWCPSCQTVLANEQVVDGACWRCGTPVTTRELEQWFLRITQYADELLDAAAGPLRLAGEGADDAAELDRPVDGVQATFPLVDAVGGDAAAIEIFTTRIDTIYGATFVLLAPEHPLVEAYLSRAPTRPRSVRRSPGSAPRIAWRGCPARSRRKASTPAASRSTRSPASASRSGWPTSCSPTTAPARSWRCRSAISAISSSRRSTACRSAPSSRPKDGEAIDPSAVDPATMTEAWAGYGRSSTPASSPACRAKRPGRRWPTTPRRRASAGGRRSTA